MKKVLIVGAGISGILLAKELKLCGVQVEIWEKSQGIGGRMATRRGDGTSWDHGAQFYSPDGLLQKYHQEWLDQNLVKPWPLPSEKPRFYSVHGMSSLAKNLSTNLTIHKNRKLCKLVKNSSQWWAEDEQQQSSCFSEVFLTCPLPQSLILLEQNSLEFPNSLKNILYSKSIVALISSKSDLPEIPFYKENPDTYFFSWTDMKAKGLSKYPAWTVVAHPDWSEENWKLSDNLILEQFKNEVSKHLSLRKFPESEWQIKKWLYSQPVKALPTEEGFISKNPHLIITGDAFGGGSIGGAARAAQSTFLNWLKL